MTGWKLVLAADEATLALVQRRMADAADACATGRLHYGDDDCVYCGSTPEEFLSMVIGGIRAEKTFLLANPRCEPTTSVDPRPIGTPDVC
jgi:hypothetical protein